MSDQKLDQLLKQWAEHESLTDLGTDCPTVSILWYHITEQQPLGDHESHVRSCSRCQKRLQLIHHELEAEVPATAGSTVVYRLTLTIGGLAAAACLTLLVLSWFQRPSDQRSHDRQIAMLFEAVDSTESLHARGPNGEPETAPTVLADWIQSVLKERDVGEAMKDQHQHEPRLIMHLKAGRLELHDGRLVLAPDIDENEAINLQDLIDRDNQASEIIVDALLRYLPDASPDDRWSIRQALNHWRAENVFGHYE